jgi:hypothetical protein
MSMSDERRQAETYEPPAIEEITGIFPSVSTAPGATGGGDSGSDEPKGPEGK